MKYFKLSALFGLLLLCLAAPLQAQDEASLGLITELSFPPMLNELAPGINLQARVIDLWVEDNLAVITAGPVLYFVDLSDLSNPTLLSTIELGEGEISWDAKLQNDLAYIGLQASNDDSTLRIYDVSDPTEPALVANYITDVFAGAHNIFIAGNVAFIGSFGAFGGPDSNPDPIDEGIWMVNISDPANPQDIGQIFTEDGNAIGSVHDMTVIGNRAYIAAWDTGFWIVDFENLDNPSELSYTVAGHHRYPALIPGPPSTHNVWPSEDGSMLWTTDEALGEQVRLFDISDLDNIQFLGRFRISGGLPVPHNVVVDGEFAYVSHYLDGLQVLKYDAEAQEIVRVVEFPSAANVPPGNPFLGAFGVFPLEDHVLITDTNRGLIVLDKAMLLSQAE